MKFDVVIHGRARKIELEPLADGRYRVVLDGVESHVDLQALPGGLYSLLIDGLQHQVDVSEGPEGMEVVVAGQRYPVEIVDPRRGSGGGRAGAKAGSAVLKSPMPGKVVKLLVAEGDEVARGAGVIVVEAMKMQNELRAPTAGRVTKIFVTEGGNVEANAKLLSIE